MEAGGGSRTPEEEGPEAVVLQEGVVHLKRFLTGEQQRDLFEGITEAAKTFSPTRARNPQSNFMKIMYYNCKSHKHLIPSSFLYLSAQACAAASDVNSCIPPTYNPDYATSFSYSDNDGRLTGHVDKVTGWVVLFSLGCTARFFVKGPLMRRKEVLNFESGDVLVFNGGTEYGIFHGIDGIVKGTSPQWLPELQNCRLSLQLRQSERNDNWLAQAAHGRSNNT